MLQSQLEAAQSELSAAREEVLREKDRHGGTAVRAMEQAQSYKAEAERLAQDLTALRDTQQQAQAARQTLEQQVVSCQARITELEAEVKERRAQVCVVLVWRLLLFLVVWEACL